MGPQSPMILINFSELIFIAISHFKSYKIAFSVKFICIYIQHKIQGTFIKKITVSKKIRKNNSKYLRKNGEKFKLHVLVQKVEKESFL